MTTTPQNLAQEFVQFRLEQATEALSNHQARGALDEWSLHTSAAAAGALAASTHWPTTRRRW